MFPVFEFKINIWVNVTDVDVHDNNYLSLAYFPTYYEGLVTMSHVNFYYNNVYNRLLSMYEDPSGIVSSSAVIDMSGVNVYCNTVYYSSSSYPFFYAYPYSHNVTFGIVCGNVRKDGTSSLEYTITRGYSSATVLFDSVCGVVSTTLTSINDDTTVVPYEGGTVVRVIADYTTFGNDISVDNVTLCGVHARYIVSYTSQEVVFVAGSRTIGDDDVIHHDMNSDDYGHCQLDIHTDNDRMYECSDYTYSDDTPITLTSNMFDFQSLNTESCYTDSASGKVCIYTMCTYIHTYRPR